MNNKKLYKSKTDKKVDGVCGGLGVYLGLDSNVVRLLWVLLTLTTAGVGIVGYIACMLILPVEPDAIDTNETV